jgi:uncharacterized membrane-anchored protein YhcB (DUF1043 family)
VTYFILGLILGIILGRVYGWMKYHYPEFQEEIHLRVARKKAERVKYEEQTDAARARMDELLDKRMRR